MLYEQAQYGPAIFVVCIFGNQSPSFLSLDCQKIKYFQFWHKIVWDSARENFVNNLDVDFWTINYRKIYCQNEVELNPFLFGQEQVITRQDLTKIHLCEMIWLGLC